LSSFGPSNLPHLRSKEENERVLHLSIFLRGFYSLVHVLRQPDVRDASGILAEQMDVGIQDRRIDGLAVLAQDCFRVSK